MYRFSQSALHAITSNRLYQQQTYRAMSGVLEVAGHDEFWSRADFAQDSNFLLGEESIDYHIDSLVELEEWDMEDTAGSEGSLSSSPIYNGPRLLPMIRDQDRVFPSVASSKNEVNGGGPSFDPTLTRCMDPNKTSEPFSLTTDGLHDSFAEQLYSQEQFDPPYTSFKLTSSNPWPHTPENYSNYVPAVYDSNSGLLHDQIDNPYLSYDGQNLPCFGSYKDSQDSPLANKSRTTMPLVEANYLGMYPSSHPRVHGLTQNFLQGRPRYQHQSSQVRATI